MSKKPSFLCDENLSKNLSKWLSSAGYTTTSVTLLGLAGANDKRIFENACRNQLTLLSADRDFLSVSNFPPPHPGIIVIAPSIKAKPGMLLVTFRQALPTIMTLELANHVYYLQADGRIILQA